MGCDIHGVIQRRDESGKWADLEGAYFPDGRNYNVFALLADVRNGIGFADVKTSDGFNPIAERRGLPKDMENDDEFKFGDHSFSWLTLREVLEYDYEQVTTLTGALTLREYARLEEKRRTYRPSWDRSLPCPESWCGSVTGQGIVTISEDEARGRLEAIKRTWPHAFTHGYPAPDFTKIIGEGDNPRTYVQASWPRRYLDCAHWFLLELLPLVKYGLDDVRLVFGFDS